MKLNTVKQYNLSADYYTFTDTVDNATGNVVRTFNLDSNIKFKGSINLFGQIVIYTDTKMVLGGRLEDILDRNGKQIYENAVWQINQVQPVIDAFGIADGYKYKAQIVSGA